MTGAGVAASRAEAGCPSARTPLARLLHALNQPLTGLQCALELASARPRPVEEYGRTLRDALKLTSRMRVLVEALGEIAGSPSFNHENAIPFALEQLISETVQSLLPVADANGVRVKLENRASLLVRGDRDLFLGVIFRLLDSALSLAREQSDLHIAVTSEQDGARIAISWTLGATPEFSPFSRQELGLLIAQAGWERSGGTWIQMRAEDLETCDLRLPLARDACRTESAENLHEMGGTR